MSFRRRPEAAGERARWTKFVQEQRVRFDAAGLPGLLREDRRSFDYFLGNGELDDSRLIFGLDMLSARERSALGRLVALYANVGLVPGWGLDTQIAHLLPPGYPQWHTWSTHPPPVPVE